MTPATPESRAPVAGRPWLELMRLSNLPTCVSNVLVGVAIGTAASNGAAAGFPFVTFAGVTGAIVLLYVGGMALNDVFDAAIDRTQRSGRPIPSGRIRRGHALGFALVTLAAGSGGLAVFGVRAFGWGLALLACIVLYDAAHKRFAAAVVLMGVCRGLVLVVSAVAVHARPDPLTLAALAGAMTIYITLVTALARGEHDTRETGRTWIFVALAAAPLATAFFVPPPHGDRAAAIGLFIVLWLGRSALLMRSRPTRPRDAIMGCLSGICLIDAYALTLLDQRALAMVAIGLFVVTWLGHRRIAGT